MSVKKTSTTEPGREAEKTPSARPITMARTILEPIRTSVGPTALPIALLTGWKSEARTPRLPCSVSRSQ